MFALICIFMITNLTYKYWYVCNMLYAVRSLDHMRNNEPAHLAACYNGTLPNHILQAMGFIFLWRPTELNPSKKIQT